MAGGRIASVDVTVVGSGPNGLSAAVICARAGLVGAGHRGAADRSAAVRAPLPDPEFPGVLHDICSAVHPLALASPFFAEFDLRARGVQLAVPEISYANPLPGRPAAIGYRDLGPHLRRARRRRVVAAAARSAGRPRRRRARLLPRRQALDAAGPGRRRCAPGCGCSRRARPAWGLLRGEDARALFTGVAAHAISTMPSLVIRGRRADARHAGAHRSGWPIPSAARRRSPTR